MHMENVGSFCRRFRRTVLNMTLQEVAGETSLKTLSGFEHGRSTNIKHLFKYVDKIENDEIKIYFMTNIIEIMGE